jgi:hypothetical protein
MATKVNTFTSFLPLNKGELNIIVKNECYFSMIFLGGNYLSKGNILQRIFGGQDEVSLIAGLRLEPDGLLITGIQEPNVVLDKRSIRPGKITNIPMVLNVLVKIPAYMNSIGFSFKIATTKRSDNFSAALDVLNDAANKSVLEAFIPTAVGKALGIGKVVKDIFDKIDSTNGLIQLVVNDFIISANANSSGSNLLQEGYLVIFVKEEEPETDEEEAFTPDNQTTNDEILLEESQKTTRKLKDNDVIFLDVDEMEKRAIDAKNGDMPEAAGAADMIEYDEENKILKVSGKVVINTYLVFKIQKDLERGKNLNASWARKLEGAVELLAGEFTKTKKKLEELEPRVLQQLNEGAALLVEDTSFTPGEKRNFKESYRKAVEEEKAKFTG